MATTPFPYLIFYEVSDGEVIIHAVRHGARDAAD
jgi:plasmid stabilization system protein ParE